MSGEEAAPRARAAQPAEGFPRSRRVRRRVDFVRIQNANIRRVSSKHFLFLLSPRLDETKSAIVSAERAAQLAPRLGVVVSKKVGNAVRRNRTKRLLREAFRKERAPALFGFDVVVIARPGAAELAASDVRRDVATALASLASKVRHFFTKGRAGTA